MIGSGFFLSRKRLLTCVTVLLAGTPLLGWAQGTAPPAAAPAAPPPAPMAAQDSAAKAAAATSAPATMPAMSDSARAALRSEIERELKTMADSLKLTPDQRAKTRPILLNHAYHVRNLRLKYATQQRTPAVVQEMQKEMQGLRDSTDAKMGQVLTADQMPQYKMRRDAWLGQTRTKMGMGGAPASTHAPADTMHKAAMAPAAAPVDTAKKK